MSDSIESHFGTLALLYDIIPTREREKTNPVEPGTPEFDMMLATLLFDVIKKRVLAHKYLSRYMLHADPEVTRRVLADMRELEVAEGDTEEPDYATLMPIAHRKMIEALQEVVEDHRHLAELVERRSETR